MYIYNHAVNCMLNIYEYVTYLFLSIHIKDERTALHLASENGHVEVVKCLLETGANIHDEDDVRYIILYFFVYLFTLFTLNILILLNEDYKIDYLLCCAYQYLK